MLKQNVDLTGKTVLVTGAAGFVGANLVMELLKSQSRIAIVGYDNVNNYYDVSLKEWRLAQIAKLAAQKPESSWTFVKANLADKKALNDVFEQYKPSVVVNLAAQAGFYFFFFNKNSCS